MSTNFLKLFIGDRQFYRKVLALMIPIMIQNGITNFVNMLDNIMIGRVGTVEMTGVAISNQLIFIFNLCIFGAISGAGILGAQFVGKKDHDGLRYTFRYKILLSIFLTVLCICIFYFAGENLANLYLTGDGDPADAVASLLFSRQYMLIMLVGLLPYAFTQCYASTLRETGETKVPMLCGMVSVLINLFLNYVLIFGKFGAPVLGVRGAAIATVIARFAELIIIAIWTHKHSDRNQFIVGVYKTMYIPKKLILQISSKGFPLLANEALWALGIAAINQCYSTLGYDVVSSMNICQTFYNVFAVAFMSVGSAVGIILGQLLGADKFDEAKDSCRKLIVFSIMISVIVGVVYFICAGFIPHIYNTTDSIMNMATRIMRICAITMPLEAMAHACYFTLRSGGKIFATMLFDSVFVCVIMFPVAFGLSHLFLPIYVVYGICQSLNLIKCIAGGALVHKGIWLRNIVN